LLPLYCRNSGATANGQRVSKFPNDRTKRVCEEAEVFDQPFERFWPFRAIVKIAIATNVDTTSSLLDWSEIGFDSGLIQVTANESKTARRRFLTMQPNLREWLLPIRKHRGSILCENFRKQFEQARTAAGILKWPENALRHSLASYHLAHFKNAATALELGPHDSRITFGHYRELVKPKEAEHYWNITPVKTERIVPLVARG
jgi:hypothetical protein